MDKKNEFNFTIFSKEIIDKQFEQIEKELDSTMDYKILLKRFHRILHNRVIPTLQYNEESDEFTIYRITDTWKGFNSNDLDCYSYNPNPKENGRAHLSGFPVFYGSLDPLTAFHEMKGSLEIGKTFYISRWKIKFKSNTNIHTLIINSLTKNSEHFLNPIIKHIHETLKNMVKNLPPKLKEGYIYAIEKMGDLFTTSGNANYHITSAYSHELLYNGKKKGINIPIIMYPSVENNFNSVNWAIHPSFVDSDNMKIQDVFEITLQENNLKNQKEDVKVNYLKKGMPNDKGIINWKIPFYSKVKLLFKELKITTYNNQIIDNKNASNIKINDSDFTIKDLIEKNIDRNKLQEKIPEFPTDSENNSPLDFEKETFKRSLILQFEHGNEISTKSEKSCINYIHIPISWTRGYKSEKK